MPANEKNSTHATSQLVIDTLKQEISEFEYNRYFKEITFSTTQSTPNSFVYEVPNIFIVKWIQTKYSEKMATIIEHQTGQKAAVQIIVKGAKKVHHHTSQKQPPHHKKESTILNPTYNFDTFVVGESNHFAFSSAKLIAQKPGKQYNPFFIYGGVGLGKTHLMQSIGNYNATKHYTILSLTAEQLMNDFTKHIGNRTMAKFKETYRNCDILLIDDIQFLSGKDNFQEEFFHTFEELYKKDKQIVLTADKKPSDIIGIEERLKSRFESGITTPINPPDLETKIAIIKKKCELDSISLSNDIILYIATHLETNIREIEGILIKIHAYASIINQQQIDLTFVKNILKDHIKDKKENITIEYIIKVIAKEMNIKPSEITSKKRHRKNIHARRVVIYLARELTQESTSSLAQYFNMKDHSAISHNIKKIKEILHSDKNEQNRLEHLKN